MYWAQTTKNLTPSSKEARSLVSTLELIARVAGDSDETLQIVLESGALDILLRIYVIFPLFSQSSIDGAEPWLALLSGCRSLLLLLVQSPQHSDTVINHPVSILWTDCRPTPPTYSREARDFRYGLSERCLAWRRVARTCAKRRVSSIYIGSLWRRNVYEVEDLEACGDLVELARYKFE